MVTKVAHICEEEGDGDNTHDVLATRRRPAHTVAPSYSRTPLRRVASKLLINLCPTRVQHLTTVNHNVFKLIGSRPEAKTLKHDRLPRKTDLRLPHDRPPPPAPHDPRPRERRHAPTLAAFAHCYPANPPRYGSVLYRAESVVGGAHYRCVVTVVSPPRPSEQCPTAVRHCLIGCRERN